MVIVAQWPLDVIFGQLLEICVCLWSKHTSLHDWNLYRGIVCAPIGNTWNFYIWAFRQGAKASHSVHFRVTLCRKPYHIFKNLGVKLSLLLLGWPIKRLVGQAGMGCFVYFLWNTTWTLMWKFHKWDQLDISAENRKKKKSSIERPWQKQRISLIKMGDVNNLSPANFICFKSPMNILLIRDEKCGNTHDVF